MYFTIHRLIEVEKETPNKVSKIDTSIKGQFPPKFTM